MAGASAGGLVMEAELKCPVCKHLFVNPVILACFHSVCLKCAVQLQQPATNASITSVGTNIACSNAGGGGGGAGIHHNGGGVCSAEGGGGGGRSSSSNSSSTGQEDDFDQVSLVSETDSGVVCSPLPSTAGGSGGTLAPLAITCPICHKSCLYDEHGAGNLCKNRALANILDRYAESRKLHIECQMCEQPAEADPATSAGSRVSTSQAASWYCEQCEVFYCQACLGAFHPQRGPLATHQLMSAIQGRSQQRAKFKISAVREMNCLEHEDNSFSMFCLMCKIPLCVMCLHDGRHATHDVQALGHMCRLQKTQLSQSLQSLSEKAKGANQLIANLKGMSAKINENCAALEESIRAHCAALIEAVERRRDELVSVARLERDNRLAKIRDKVSQCSRGLQGTTSLLQLCIEALKEPEPTVFLQIGGILINRVKGCEQEWTKEHRQTSAMNNFDFEINYQAALDQIRMLDYTKNKPPGTPIIMADECGVVNNSMTISWRAAIDQSPVDAFVLEITDHDDATSFREVYCGPDNICTIDGLHFNTPYSVRVKALNGHGVSDYSQVVSLETHSVASFVLDAATAHPDILASEDRLVVTADAFEHRLVLGNLGFSSGVHYWELTLTRYEGCTSDVVCGVARYHAARDLMLGKDENGFSMYIDQQRSWFLHDDAHHTRTPLGIREGDVIGVLLDMDRDGTLSFFVNGTLQGGVPAFRGLDGVLYPAVSVNRFVELSLRTGLDPPLGVC